MVNIIPITKARINLGGIIKKVHLNKEYFILEKDGFPVAGIMDIDEFEDYLDIKNLKIQKDIQKSITEYKKGKTKPAHLLLKSLGRVK